MEIFGRMQMTNTKMIKITGCSDSLLWYKNKVGDYVKFLREYDDCYMSREPSGFANIVKKCDGIVVDTAVVNIEPGHEEKEFTATKQEEFLNILQEECAEVIQAVSKIKRFGWREENILNLQLEVGDLLCMLDMLPKYAPAIASANWDDLKERKKTKLEKYSSLV